MGREYFRAKLHLPRGRVSSHQRQFHKGEGIRNNENSSCRKPSHSAKRLTRHALGWNATLCIGPTRQELLLHTIVSSTARYSNTQCKNGQQQYRTRVTSRFQLLKTHQQSTLVSERSSCFYIRAIRIDFILRIVLPASQSAH